MIKIRAEHRKRHKEVRGGTRSAGAAAARRGCQLQSAAGRQDSQGAATGGESWETCVSCLPRRQTTSLCFTGPSPPHFCSPPATPRLPPRNPPLHRKKKQKKKEKARATSIRARRGYKQEKGGGAEGAEMRERRWRSGETKMETRVGQSTAQ